MKTTPSLKSIFLETTLKRFNVEICGNELIIPLCDRTGKVVHHLPKKIGDLTDDTNLYQFDILYNWDALTINNKRYLVVTNSIHNVWWLWQSGFSYVVGLLSCNPGNATLEYLDSMLAKSGAIWIVMDKTSPAVSGETTVISKLAEVRLVKKIVLDQVIGINHNQVQKLFNEHV
jgi:hypothetical protein